MEWQGIDLSANRQKNWILAILKSVKQITLSFLILGTISILLTFYNWQKKTEIQPLELQLSQRNTEIFNMEQHLLLLKNDGQIQLPTANSNHIDDFVRIIINLPLKNGGVTSIQIYSDDALYMRMSGKLDEHTDFQNVEQYLKEFVFIELKTDYVKLNDKNETDFIFTLKYSEVKK